MSVLIVLLQKLLTANPQWVAASRSHFNDDGLRIDNGQLQGDSSTPFASYFPDIDSNSVFNQFGGDETTTARELHNRLILAPNLVSKGSFSSPYGEVETFIDPSTGHSITFASGGGVVLEQSLVPRADYVRNFGWQTQQQREEAILADYYAWRARHGYDSGHPVGQEAYPVAAPVTDSVADPTETYRDWLARVDAAKWEVVDGNPSSDQAVEIGSRPMSEIVDGTLLARDFFESKNSLLSLLTVGDFPKSVKLENVNGYDLKRALGELTKTDKEVTLSKPNQHGEVTFTDTSSGAVVMYNYYGQIITSTMADFFDKRNSLFDKLDSGNHLNRGELKNATKAEFRNALEVLVTQGNSNVSTKQIEGATIYIDNDTGNEIVIDCNGEVVTDRLTANEFLATGNPLISKLKLSDLSESINADNADAVELREALERLAKRNPNVSVSTSKHSETIFVDGATKHRVLYGSNGDIVLVTNSRGTRDLVGKIAAVVA